jgi:hypothetical protein
MITKNSYKIPRNVYLILLIIVASIAIPFLAIQKALNLLDFGLHETTRVLGVSGGVLFIVGGLVLVSIMGFSILKNKVLHALGAYILFLPLSYLGGKFFYLSINTTNNTNIVISLPTISLITFLFLVSIIKPDTPRKNIASGLRVFEILLWLYVIAGFIPQLLFRSVLDSFLVSYDSLFQFLFLFYVVSYAVDTMADIKSIIICLIGSMVVSIVITFVKFGLLGTYTVSFWGNRFFTLSSFPLFIGLFSAIYFIFTLYLSHTSTKRIGIYFWFIIGGGLFFIMIYTQTRGAYLSLLIGLIILMLYKSEIMFVLKSIAVYGLCAIPLLPLIIKIFTERTTTFNIFMIDTAIIRFKLWAVSIPYVLSNFITGTGIGNQALFIVEGSKGLVSHNIFLFMIQDLGGIATIIFIIMFSITLIRLFMASVHTKGLTYTNFYAYIFIALIMWLLFSNTSSLSITSHFLSGNHAEETMVFYTLLFLAWSGLRILKKSDTRVDYLPKKTK